MKKYLLISLLVLPFAVNALMPEERQTGVVSNSVTNVADTPALDDPSFETGTPNSFWSETSTNFGTPLCDFGACGFGTGTGPNNGTFWAWFGGITGFLEEGSASQMVEMPIAGGIELTFFLEIAVCGTTGFLEILVDGNQEYFIDENDPACGSLGYNQITVDLSAYSGQTVNLEFHSITQAGNAPINFFVDDIALAATRNPDPIPTASFTGLVLLSMLLMFVGRRKLS